MVSSGPAWKPEMDCIKKDKWREINGYLVKGPFEKDPTSVVVEQTSYDEKTQEFTPKTEVSAARYITTSAVILLPHLKK